MTMCIGVDTAGTKVLPNLVVQKTFALERSTQATGSASEEGIELAVKSTGKEKVMCVRRHAI